jgi:hypothetical protein
LAKDLSRRSIALIAVVMVAATALTVWGTWFVLQTYVMVRPDPLYKAGGLKPGQR